MGMYTEFHFNSKLKKNTPKQIISILKFMIEDKQDEPKSLPDHAFFKIPEWQYTLRSDSYYFDADTHNTLRYDQISRFYYLCIRCNLKNYDCNIELFCDWIMPYLNKIDGEFLGFSRYEETNIPTLIFYKE